MKYFLIIIILLLGACQGKKKTAAVEARDTYYTCSMHPQVMQDGPGKCPICGMELIPVKKGTGPADESIVLSDQQVQLGNIKVDTIGNGHIGNKMVLTATLNIDETRSTMVSARIRGRVERLYHKNTGEYLHKGDKLYDLYSEELNNAQQEYILALERQKTLDNSIIDFKQLVEAARNKLLLWGMNAPQVEELAKTKQHSTTTTFYSPSEGYITEVQGHEGDYLSEGAPILRLADLSSLWVEAQVYTSQLSQLDQHAKAMVRIPDLPGSEWTGQIVFVSPEVNPDTRINLIRVELPNAGGLLKPGMPAYVTLTGRQGYSLTLPMAAVIQNEKSKVVWIETGHNVFRPVMVETGLEDGNQVEIRSGLKAGDMVVTSGAYLLNSEYIFRHGSDPMAGMKM
jgi:Cu(I)/Ag(I) efflux system membrane fusion protein